VPGDGGRTTVSPLPIAIAGAACISSSAVVMTLTGSSASVTALGRCAFALPVLGLLTMLDRKRGAAPLGTRGRWLARLSGVVLAGDLVLWSHSIGAIGAGLGTVIPNLQVLIISLLGWLVLGERPRRSLLFAAPVMLAGLVLVGGLTGAHAYGADPALGVAEGGGVAVLYSLYIMTLRQATSPASFAAKSASQPSAVAALYEATLGATIGSVVLGLVLRDFRLGPAWPALGWLVLLAMTSQVVGWLLITVSMPRLPAWMISVVLLTQPAGSVLLGYLFLSERPSAVQVLGVVLMLIGVLIAAGKRTAQHENHPPGPGVVEGNIPAEVAVPGGDREAAG
jgi:drug/metabolite transporter (DMT)-like permease